MRRLEAFLRAVVPLPARDGGHRVRRARTANGPPRCPPARRSNLYLWDIRPNLSERDCGEMIIEEPDGRRFRRDPLPRVDCRYLVTAWTSEVRDEHSLLGDVLSALLLHPVIEAEHLQGVFADGAAAARRCSCAAATAARTRTSGRRWAGSSSPASTWWSR